MRELASKLRQPFFSWGAQLAVAMLSLLSGAPDAEQEVSAAFQVGTAGGQPEAKQAYISQLSFLRRDQGRGWQHQPKRNREVDVIRPGAGDCRAVPAVVQAAGEMVCAHSGGDALGWPVASFARWGQEVSTIGVRTVPCYFFGLLSSQGTESYEAVGSSTPRLGMTTGAATLADPL